MSHHAVNTRTIADVGEFGLIEIIKQSIPFRDPRLVVGIGDDAAAFRATPGSLTLATTDIQVEGRHFDRRFITPYQLGLRGAAINLSDIAAMGGTPTYALVSLALPQDLDVDWVRELYRGLHEEITQHHAAVIGGNLAATKGAIIVDITMFGEVPEGQEVTRGKGKPGDVVFVTGTLGASAAGLQALQRGLDRRRPDVSAVIAAHLTPAARVPEGMVIGASRLVTAMIDISDGLAGDLGHICEAGGVGARLYADRIPISLDARTIARALGIDPLDLALHGGEDYELCFTCSPSDAAMLAKVVRSATGIPVTEVGSLTETLGIVLVQPDGRAASLARLGWDHFAKP